MRPGAPLPVVDEAPGAAAGRRRVPWRLLGSALILAVVLTLLPLGELKAAFARIPLPVYLLSVPGYLALHLLGVTKWRLMIATAGGGLAPGHAVRCYYYGLFGNTFLPSVVGGDVVRAGLAARLADNPTAVVIGSVVDRTLDVLALAVVAGLGIVLLPGVLDPRNRLVFWSVMAVLGVGAALAAVAWALLPAARLPYRVRRVAVRVRRSVRATRADPAKVLTALALGVVLQLALVGLNAGLGAAAGIAIPFTTWLFAWPMAKLSALVPLTQGGLGVREAALAGLLAPFGVEPVLAVAAGLAFQAVVITGGLAGGGIAALLGRGAADRPGAP